MIVRTDGGVFISDQVETGRGRTGGKCFGVKRCGVVPDILTYAMGLANGSGMGLLQALELVEDRNTKTPAPVAPALVLEAARENRLLISKGGMYRQRHRISPPVNIARTDVDQFIEWFDHGLSPCATASGRAR
jgi:4-aminobutyrate aminotransferase-like enzyme